MRAASVIVILLCGATAAAETVELEASKDNTIYGPPGTTESNGAGDYIFTGKSGASQVLRALIHFDVAGAIPPGATITSATLTLRTTTPKSGTEVTVAAHRLTTDWGEGASNAPKGEAIGTTGLPGDATWTHAILPNDTWASAGGDYPGTVSASTQVHLSNQSYDWSGPGMVADVQAFLDDPAQNFGWILLGGEGALAKRYASRTNFTAANRPKLTVEYETGPPPIVDATTDIDFATATGIAGNSNVGFGGAVGGGTLVLDSDHEGNLGLQFTRGAGNFDDFLVLYLDTSAGGFGDTRSALDICVFTITDDRIADAILSAHRRGVKTRIITDDDKAHDLGSDIKKLAKAGIAVRRDRTDAHMHHKFALFDSRILLTGSYNWTRAAARENEENVIVTDDHRLVSAFVRQFDALWDALA